MTNQQQALVGGSSSAREDSETEYEVEENFVDH